MRSPFTKYGMPQVAAYPAVLVAVMCAWASFYWRVFSAKLQMGLWFWLVGLLPEAVLLCLLLWILSFFRNPRRTIPDDPALLLAPADGKISDIEEVHEPAIGASKALRIGVFLSIFNVHINRMPCTARIQKIIYRPGKFVNALNKDCSRLNESNNLILERLSVPNDKLLLRQISGAIARRIVCAADEQQVFPAGEPFGMIKFGSRTELILPLRENAKCLVKVGDKVKAGKTPLIRYE